MNRRWLWCVWWVLAALSGCATPTPPAEQRWVVNPAYYWQAVRGHLGVMAAARPLTDWLADPTTPEPLKARLTRAQAVRAFASDTLKLPHNSSYTRYAQLPGRAVVWNVVAAPADALVLHRWCFPVAGCVGYQGFYNEADARAHAVSLPSTWDVAVYPVVAYSTLGWTNWLGGDPLLSTFMAYPEGEWARLVFHELAHQAVYVAGDTRFNESFATAVERLGGALWLERADPATREAYQAFDQRRQAFRALLREARAALQVAYQKTDAAERLAGKTQAMATVRQRYADLKTSWGGYAGYDAWMAQLNNALLALQSDYDDLVPAFEALYHEQGRDFGRFLVAAGDLARLPQPDRYGRLSTLAVTPTALTHTAP